MSNRRSGTESPDFDRLAEDREIVAEARLDRAEIKELRAALEKSVELQTHYAGILNQYDGGARMQFYSADEWMERLRKLSAPVPHG